MREFVAALLPTEARRQALAALLAAGDEAALRDRARAATRATPKPSCKLAEPAGRAGSHRRGARAAGPSSRDRRDAPSRRTRPAWRSTPDDDYDERLDALLDQVKADEDARQQYVDILELMGPDDPRTAGYRKKLTSRLFKRTATLRRQASLVRRVYADAYLPLSCGASRA